MNIPILMMLCYYASIIMTMPTLGHMGAGVSMPRLHISFNENSGYKLILVRHNIPLHGQTTMHVSLLMHWTMQHVETPRMITITMIIDNCTVQLLQKGCGR